MVDVAMATRRPVLGPEIESHGSSFGFRALPACARFAFRAKAPPARAAGFDLALAINRFSRNGALAAARTGPDEYLLLAPEDAPVAAEIAAAMGSQFHALVDIGHRDAALELSGPAVCDMLNAGCPLDLGLAAFAVGMATRTLFGKAEVVLMREDARRFRLECRRSFTPYVRDFLRAAARELGGSA